MTTVVIKLQLKEIRMRFNYWLFHKLIKIRIKESLDDTKSPKGSFFS